MTRPFEARLPKAEPTRDAIAAAIPVLRTQRLELRAPRVEDFAILEPIWRSERGRFIGGPFTEEDGWLDFTQAVAGWVLRGVGYWTVTKAEDGAVLGLIGIGAETADPELEFGWLLTREAEGQGFATEAARAVHDYAFGTLGLDTLVSFIDKQNTRSIAVAERLSARLDPAAVPAAFADQDFAYRHDPEAFDD